MQENNLFFVYLLDSSINNDVVDCKCDKNVVLVNIKITTLMMFYLIINSVISICMYSLSIYFCLSINIAFLAEAVLPLSSFSD